MSGWEGDWAGRWVALAGRVGATGVAEKVANARFGQGFLIQDARHTDTRFKRKEQRPTSLHETKYEWIEEHLLCVRGCPGPPNPLHATEAARSHMNTAWATGTLETLHSASFSAFVLSSARLSTCTRRKCVPKTFPVCNGERALCASGGKILCI